MLLDVILVILIGLAAGWLAAMLIRGRGLGCLGNVLLGIVGAVIGGFLLDLLGVGFGGLAGRLVTAFIGAVVVLGVVGVIWKR